MFGLNTALKHRIAFVIFNVAAVVGAYFVLFLPIYDFFVGQNEKIEELTLNIAHVEILARQEDAVAKLVGDFNSNQKMTAFWTGKSEGIASANLQARLKQMVEASSSSVQSIQGIDQKVVNNMRLIGAHVAMAGTNSAIYEVLEAIERSSPPLFVTTLTIRSPAVIPDSVQAQETNLNVQLDVYGAFNATPASD